MSRRTNLLAPTWQISRFFKALLVINLVGLAYAQDETQSPKEEKPFIHPGISHTRETLDFVKSKIDAKEEPWVEAWNTLCKYRYSNILWEPRPYAQVERGASNKHRVGSDEFYLDGGAAYSHALRYYFSEDQSHAKKSAEIIKAWSDKLESISDHDARLLVGMAGIRFCNAAEILNHCWDGWPQEERVAFEKMITEIWYPIIKDFYPSANGNWDASMIQTMMAMGIYLDDRAMYERARDYFLAEEGNGGVRLYFKPSGQCQESGRDQSHTQMGLEFLLNSAEIAWIQGDDLYSSANNLLLKGFEYTAKYNLGYEVPYEPYRSFEGRYHYKEISTKARGRLRAMYERAYNHYHNRLGLEPPYIKEAIGKTRPESAPRGTSLPWATLMSAEQPANLVPLGGQ